MPQYVTGNVKRREDIQLHKYIDILYLFSVECGGVVATEN